MSEKQSVQSLSRVHSLQPHGLQHARLPCPSPAPGTCSNSCLLSRWCHPAILFSVVPFSSFPQSLPASGSFQMSQLFARGGQSTGVSASTSVLPEHPGLISFRMGWLDLLAVQGTLKRLLQHHSSKASILRYSAFFTVQLSHPCITTGKNIALTRWTFLGKVMSLLLNMLCRLFNSNNKKKCSKETLVLRLCPMIYITNIWGSFVFQHYVTGPTSSFRICNLQ